MPIPSGDTQTCRDCKENLPLERFSRNNRKDGYRRPECRSCQHKRSEKINPNYQYTKGAVAARNNHDMPQSTIQRFKTEKLRAQKNLCVYCTASLNISNCHLDHRIPLAKGGSNFSGNLQVLCKRCNGEKHSKNHAEYIDWLRDVKEHLKPDRPKSLFDKH